jgi:hypothetical protein
MKSFCLIPIFIFSALTAIAGSSIPSQLVGSWSANTPNGSAYLFVRPDGVLVISSSVGIPGIATYDSKNSTLIASLRDEQVEKAKAILTYDQHASTITLTKLICYYDLHGPSGKLPKPQEEKPNMIFTHREDRLPDFVRSLDIRVLQNTAKQGAAASP